VKEGECSTFTDASYFAFALFSLPALFLPLIKLFWGDPGFLPLSPSGVIGKIRDKTQQKGDIEGVRMETEGERGGRRIR